MWKIAFEMGDEVVRSYNQEHGHIMAIDQAKGYDSTRYKVTSPTNPLGYTWEWEDHLELPPLPDNVVQMDQYRQQSPQQTPPNVAKVGWSFGQSKTEWVKPDYPGRFESFVYKVMDALRIPTRDDNLVAQYHDSILRITGGLVPWYRDKPSGRSGPWDKEREQLKLGIQEIIPQLPIMQQKQIPNQDARQQMDQEHADQFYNGIVPNDPKMRSQYPRQLPVSSWRLGNEQFQDAAAEELQNYEALARDIMRTLPEAEWPQWVKNQAHKMVWGDPKPADMTPYPNVDDKPGKDTFPEDWNFESKIAWSPFKKQEPVEEALPPIIHGETGKYPGEYDAPREGMPWFIYDGNVIAGGVGDGHARMYKDLTEQGYDKDKLVDSPQGRVFPDGILHYEYDEPLTPEDIAKLEEAYKQYRIAKVSAGGPAIPADYSDEDPLDMENAKQLVQDLDSQWWTRPPDVQRQAIANAFRAALTSPRQNLQWNSIVYQDLAHIGPEVSDPDHFEQTIRDKKAKWDTFGQQSIDTVERHSDDPEHIAHMQRQQGMSKYFPGIWKNVRNAAVVGPYIEQLRQAALADVARGGTGQSFRQELLDMNIPGIGPKIAAFVWLLLCPTTSKIATIDVHMMRALGQKDESPASYADYLKFENQLDEQRQTMGYDDVPLGAFQWALWDKTRSPGYHQDHTPLKPLDPTPWHQVDWAPQPYARKTPPPEVSPDQQSLFPEQQAPIVTGAHWKIIV